jgi:hypothetical protein
MVVWGLLIMALGLVVAKPAVAEDLFVTK